jgi:hypothetical protein
MKSRSATVCHQTVLVLGGHRGLIRAFTANAERTYALCRVPGLLALLIGATVTAHSIPKRHGYSPSRARRWTTVLRRSFFGHRVWRLFV